MHISNVSPRAASGSLATQQFLLRAQSHKKFNRLGLGVNRWGLAAQLLFAAVSRLPLLASGCRELIPQGLERPGRETDPSLPLINLVKKARVVCVEGGK